MTREEAISYFKRHIDLYCVTGICREAEEMAIKALEQEPKTGHWEYVQYDGNPNIGNWHCSECGRIVSGAITDCSPVYSYKFCPNCGADMREGE